VVRTAVDRPVVDRKRRAVRGTFEPVAVQAIFRKLPAGNSAPHRRGLVDCRGVGEQIGSGLPLASVSKGTLAGMLVPRRRMYCDALTFEILKVITLTRCRDAASPAAVVERLITAADVFLAALGTAASVSVVPSAGSASSSATRPSKSGVPRRLCSPRPCRE